MVKKEFNSEPAYNEKYIKTKIIFFKVKINTKFHNNRFQTKALNVFAYLKY